MKAQRILWPLMGALVLSACSGAKFRVNNRQPQGKTSAHSADGSKDYTGNVDQLVDPVDAATQVDDGSGNVAQPGGADASAPGTVDQPSSSCNGNCPPAATPAPVPAPAPGTVAQHPSGSGHSGSNCLQTPGTASQPSVSGGAFGTVAQPSGSCSNGNCPPAATPAPVPAPAPAPGTVAQQPSGSCSNGSCPPAATPAPVPAPAPGTVAQQPSGSCSNGSCPPAVTPGHAPTPAPTPAPAPAPGTVAQPSGSCTGANCPATGNTQSPVSQPGTCPNITVKNIPGGWVIPPTDANGKPVYVQVADKKKAQLTQFYNSKGFFGLPVGSTIQASKNVPVGSKLNVNVSNSYDFDSFELVDPCTIPLTLVSPPSKSLNTFCDSFEDTWNGSLQQQAGSLSPGNPAVSQAIADLQKCSDLATQKYGLPSNDVGEELLYGMAGITRIGFDLEHSIGGFISGEVPRTIASEIKECAAAVNQKYKGALVGFKSCQCGHAPVPPPDVP